MSARLKLVHLFSWRFDRNGREKFDGEGKRTLNSEGAGRTLGSISLGLSNGFCILKLHEITSAVILRGLYHYQYDNGTFEMPQRVELWYLAYILDNNRASNKEYVAAIFYCFAV